MELAVFGMVFGMTIQLQVSNKRVKTFLAEEEIEEMPSDETAPEGISLPIILVSYPIFRIRRIYEKWLFLMGPK
jgi:hypothetical protein